MKKKVIVINQSNYIPWKGYFDLIAMADVFVFMDNVQYTNADWRNRNKIKTINKLQWLTVPCGSSRSRLISEVVIKESHWQKKHFDSICHAYSRAPYFDMYMSFLKELYLERVWCNLSDLNQFFIKKVSKEYLNLDTFFSTNGIKADSFSSNERLLNIIQKHKGQCYLSGPNAQGYLDLSLFQNAGVEVKWMDYSGYKTYSQLHGGFEHGVSILDVLFNCGPNAKNMLKASITT